mmetsp:Transcript_43281/g.110732  ORF Transcript_43281/g.110732 Transcript_43281/m.110732 type:complete len:477 (+) Transcript_43281:398-1828(+)
MDSPPLTRRGPAEEDVPKDSRPAVPSLGLAAAFGGLDVGREDSSSGAAKGGAGAAGSSDVTSSSVISSSDGGSDWSSSGDGGEEEADAAPTPSAARGRPAGLPALGLGGLGLSVGGRNAEGAAPAAATDAAGAAGLPPGRGLNLAAVAPADSPRSPMSEGVTPSSAPGGGGGVPNKLKLTLALPRSPVDRPSGGLRGGDDVPESKQKDADVVKVDLLSAGFHLKLPQEAGAGMAAGEGVNAKALQDIRTRCVSSLGIAPDDLCFYEMRPLDAQGAPAAGQAGARHIAVAVGNSTFSLAALEDLLSDNKKLAAAAERSSGALESLENMMRDQTHTFTRTQLRAAELEADARRLADKVRLLEAEAETLRDQLRRSDQLRLQGQRALDELKHEFESLTQDIAASGLSPGYVKRNPSPRNSNNQSMRSPRHRPPSAPQAVGFQQLLMPDSRVTHVLDRLCSEEVLTRLEKCLGSMTGGDT